MHDPETVDPLNPEPAPDATLRLSVGAQVSIGSDQTQKLALPKMDDPPLRVQKVDQPAKAAGQTQKRPLRPAAPRPLGWKLSLLFGALLVIGVAAYLVFTRWPAVQPPPSPVAVTPESASPGLQVYLEQAKAGDAHAMRMLGVMYYYGLNVPQDREKGLDWYRKAAEKGSDAAKSELSKIEGGS